MQLTANRQEDGSSYLRLIRACLEANHGRPTISRRGVIDSGRSDRLTTVIIAKRRLYGCFLNRRMHPEVR